MNSQLPGYDVTNTTATTADPSAYGHLGSINTAFTASSDDYESHDNARARKRRMTVSDDRRGDDVHGFTLPETMGDSFFGDIIDQSHQHAQNPGSLMSAATMPILPMASSGDDASLNGALSNGMALGGIGFSHGACGQDVCDSTYPQMHNPLGSPPLNGRPNGRKHQSLSIAISNSFHNDLNSQEPPTPSMFSPSFANAMDSAAAAADGAAAAVMSPPSIFYNTTSPYTPSHAYHHSFSMPGTTQHRHSVSIFDASGTSVGSFASDAMEHHSGAAGHTGAGIPQALSTATSFRTNTMTSSAGGAAEEDYSVGLQISMNAAVAAAMNGGYNESSHNRSSSTASAFSRVHAHGGASQMMAAGSQNPTGLGLDINTTLASFANIPGLEPFPSASLDRQHSFAHSLAGGDSASNAYGIMSTEPSSLFSPMDPTATLNAAVGQNRFVQAVNGGNMMATDSPMASVMENMIASPIVGRVRDGVRSPVAGSSKRSSRKRAATVATIRTDCSHTQQAAGLVSMSAQGSSSGGAMVLSRQSSETAAYTGPVFNSQAVVQGTGSKVVMVLTSKVAQKSYGTEKRFLCPPPTILLFGDDWKLPTLNDQQAAGSGSDFTSNMPRISVSVPTNDVSGTAADPSDSLAGSSPESRISPLEWLAQPDPAPKPKAHVPHNPVPPVRAPRDGDTVTGRFVAKQLFINDVDEKRKKVSVKVRLHDPSGQVVINEFESRPIKVISKPSKKRQSVKNVDLCIHHGSTISLFNRLRSQTVSTKYLGATRSMSVGGPRPFWFPACDSDSSASSGARAGSSSTTTFVARNSVWDPFIIWIVNTQLGQKEIDAFNERIAENPTPIPGYPTPPTFAMQPQCPPDFDHGGSCSSPGEPGDSIQIDSDSMGQSQSRAPIPILYNQPVILQCVSTGMCSPVLTLRKVEKGSTAVGSFYGRDHSRDVLGDPVSQLHKVAFEVRVQTREELPAVTVTPAGLNTRVGSYLTCMGDIVGLNATCDGRQVTSDGAGNSKSRGSPAQGRKQAKEGASAGTTSWSEDVGDNAVWTMVGTDCTIYRFDYPSAADILAQLQQTTVAAGNLPVTPSATESSSLTSSHASLALPPTPKSPTGMNDYGHASSQSQFSLEMMLAEHRSAANTAAAVAAAVNGMNGADFQPGSIDASLAAAVYGMGMPVVGAGGMPGHGGPHHHILPSSQSYSLSTPTSTDNHRNYAGGNEGGPNYGVSMQRDAMVPIVFKCSVQHPPTINPSALDGRRRQRDGAASTQSATERSYVSLSGLNFTPDMVVLFDGQQSVITEFKSPDSIACLGPLPSDFGVADNAGGQNKPLHQPTSPSDSDASSAHPQSGDEAQSFGLLNGSTSGPPRSNRASSTDSTTSSATAATHDGQIVSSVSASVSGKTSSTATKIPIYLSCNGGAGPTFKTGQFYNLHL
ncbi:hypothetical protein LPJ53_000331 [Coemansia erecta]|uniref:LAG1-DNAbind-domain-containing protein n=1 Tax=Coemansia erecta TaxID=147472 RepID=A0A9W8CVA1_9FUNG|nr:hypothetical protein LPJ53_000331 [Coemansia erecta]